MIFQNFFIYIDFIWKACENSDVDIIYYLLLKGKENIQSIINRNHQIKKISIPSNVTSINIKAFIDCISLKQVVILSSIPKIMEGTFQNCLSLTDITIPSSVTIIESYSFSKCTSLRKVKMSSSVVKICMYAFCNCIGVLKSI